MKKLVLVLTLVSLGSMAWAQEKDAPMPETGNEEMTEPANGTRAGSQSLSVDVKIGTGIESYEPTGVSEAFPASTETLIGWTKVTGAQPPAEIVHVWILNGTEVASVTLPVKSASYRTWSRKTVAGATGNWTFVVKDSAGNTLGTSKFTVEGEGSTAPAATPQETAPAPAQSPAATPTPGRSPMATPTPMKSPAR